MSVVQSSARVKNRVSFVDGTVRTLISPVSNLTRATHRSFSNLSTGIFKAQFLISENQRLKDQVNALSMYDETITRYTQEIDSLRSLNQLSATYNRPKVFADVQGYFPLENRITLNVGSKQGIAPGMPVITGAGLLGTVQTVTSSECQVRLLNSVGQSVGAMAASHTPPLAGMLRADTPFPSVLFSDPAAPVQMNDLITTSGFSNRIPRGIPIGRVVQIIDSLETGTRKAMVNLSVNIGSVREVVVLL